MRWWVILAAVMSLTGRENALAQRVAGRIAILEKDNKPSPDLGAAVVYLEATGGGGGPAAAPDTLDVVINDKVYVPRVLVAPAGSMVRFPNHDPFNHNVFSVSEPNQFDLGLYGRGEARTQVFAHPGLVRVYCNVHPRMVAYLVVMANRFYAQPGADGTFAIERVPPGRYRLHVWHERVAAEIVKEVNVPAAGVSDLQISLNARFYRWQAHRNKYGREYPTNAGRERY
jgi:plastocyanin